MKKLKYFNLSKEVTKVFLAIEDEILMNAAKRLRIHKSLLDTETIESWQLAKLNQLGELNQDNIKTLAKHSKLAYEEMETMLIESGYSAVREIEGDLVKGKEKGILLNPPSIKDSQVLINILETYERNAKNIINKASNTILNQAGIKYKEVVVDVVGKVITGVSTPHQALREVASKWANMGVPALIDKSGKQWSTEAYISMVARTEAGNVATDMQFERMDEYGADLIEVSSHSGSRPGCEPYQGAIYSKNGNNKDYPDFGNTSYGGAAGLLGINCGHFIYPYIPGITGQRYFPYDKEENDRIYAESQEQRYHERQIRAAKNEYNMMKGIGDKEGMEMARQKVLGSQANIRNFIDETGRTRRRNREQLGVNNPHVR